MNGVTVRILNIGYKCKKDGTRVTKATLQVFVGDRRFLAGRQLILVYGPMHPSLQSTQTTWPQRAHREDPTSGSLHAI